MKARMHAKRHRKERMKSLTRIGHLDDLAAVHPGPADLGPVEGLRLQGHEEVGQQAREVLADGGVRVGHVLDRHVAEVEREGTRAEALEQPVMSGTQFEKMLHFYLFGMFVVPDVVQAVGHGGGVAQGQVGPSHLVRAVQGHQRGQPHPVREVGGVLKGGESGRGVLEGDGSKSI